MPRFTTKIIALKIGYAFVLLGVSVRAAPDLEDIKSVTVYSGLAAYSTRQTEFGLFNFYVPLGQPLPEGFYMKGRVYNFMFVHGEKGEPKAASFEALFPGPLVFGVFFTEMPEGTGLPLYLVALANGEVGFKKGWLSLGLVNGFHPFFTRNPYHDAGLRLGFGHKHDFGISVYEQDRMRLSGVDYGVRADYQVFFGL